MPKKLYRVEFEDAIVEADDADDAEWVAEDQVRVAWVQRVDENGKEIFDEDEEG